MKKSFVLKDESGRPSGYLMQAGEHIRCRIHHDGAAGMTLLFADGGSAEFNVEGDGREAVWTGAGETLCGGYAHAGGRLIAWSDREAAIAFERHEAQRRVRCVQESTAPAETAQNAPDERTSGESTVSGYVFPERRWPPPCCMAARYVSGAWQEETEQA